MGVFSAKGGSTSGGKLNDFVAYKYNTENIESKTDPENLDLILGDKCDESCDSKNGH